MKNFTRADAHNMYYWAFSWHISFSIIHSGDLLYDGLHMVRHLQVLQVIMLAIQATDGQMDSSDSDFFGKINMGMLNMGESAESGVMSKKN